MALLHRFKLLAYLLVLVSLLGFTYAAENFGLMALVVVLTALSWWLVEAGNGPPIPRWVINAGVLAAAIMLFIELVIYRQPNLLLGLGHFMAGLIVCKLFETKTNRDYGQILILSLLLILSGAILTASPVFGVILLIYLGLGLYVCLLFHLRCETERAMRRGSAADPMITMPEKQKAMDRELRKIGIGAGIFLFLFASAVFVLFPRTGVPGMLASWRIGQAPVETGFTNDVTMGGDQINLQLSDAIIGEVRLMQNGQNIGSEGYQPYFLGTTNDVYDETTHGWLMSQQILDSSENILANAGHTSQLVPARQYDLDNVIDEHFTINDIQDSTLFSVGFNTTAVTISSTSNLVLNRTADGALTCSSKDSSSVKDGDSVTYDIQSATTYDPAVIGPADPELFPYSPPSENPILPNFAITSTAIPPRIVGIAREVAGNLLNAEKTGADAAKYNLRLADRFSTWLSTTYPYSLRVSPVDKRLDPTEDFLVNKTKIGGYCEYFASAMVMMCRAVGVPARLVNGYHGGDFNSVGGYYVIRQKFAHSWVQVYAPGRGWVDYDPTPASSLTSAESPREWYSGMSDFFEWLRLQWLQNIIAFNEAMRADILQNTFTTIKSAIHSAIKTVTGFENQLQLWFSDPKIGRTLRITALGACVLIVAIGAWILHIIRKRRGLVAKIVRGMDRKTQRQMSRDLAFLDKLMHLLRLTGLQRYSYQTPMEYVHDASRLHGAALPEAEQLVNVFYDIRFGSQKVSANLAERIRDQLKALKQRLKQNKK